jgi:hypothetical protein
MPQADNKLNPDPLCHYAFFLPCQQGGMEFVKKVEGKRNETMRTWGGEKMMSMDHKCNHILN